MKRIVTTALLALGLHAAAARAEPLPVVAAENFYGNVIAQIGGAHVAVTSILSSPDQDPHLFEASASTARALAAARLVVYSGIGYDDWMTKLTAASKGQARQVVVVARMAGHKDGDNPHIWYDVALVSGFAKNIAARLETLDPANAAAYRAGAAAFEKSLAPLRARIAAMKGKYAGMPVTATEPVFGYMATALGLVMRNEALQLAVMNETEPSAKQIAAFEKDLRTHAVKALIFNSQTGEAISRRFQKVATESHVPLVGVSETLPPGKSYQEWMLSQLEALDRALAGR
jgi:zinc/manganese transport system substrate-binding protein